MTEKSKPVPDRRKFLAEAFRYAALGALGAISGAALAKRSRLVREGQCVDSGLCKECSSFEKCYKPQVWQIDPYKCIACGNCATYCVLEESAVKCVQVYPICGYCKICFGFFEPEPHDINEGAENQLCPTGAIIRTYIEDPYYEYTIDESLCIGCGKCVKGCTTFGNGSFFLQVRHDRCLNCNECAIAAACPSGAFVRVPAERPYLLKEVGHAE